MVDPLTAGPRLTAADEAIVRAVLLLQRLPGVGDIGLSALVERFGSAPNAWQAPSGAFAAVVGPAATQARAEPERVRRVEEALEWCRARDVFVRHRWSPDYPARLAHVEHPPGALFLMGDPDLLGADVDVVTIVGSRRSTEYGRRVARDLAAVAARHGVVVASGLALGVDGAAHRGAIDAGGRTMAVLGSGFARPHPRSHRDLFQRIAREGLLVSEFLPAELPLPHHFPRRNRTLAGVAGLVVVVEAALRSGALNTARHASDLHRDVAVVPGPIYAPTSRGTNELLREAYPLPTPEALIEYFPRARQEALTLDPAEPPEDLGAPARRVWAALEGGPGHVDELALRSRLPTADTLMALSLLEVDGWVRQEPGLRFSRSAVCT